MVLLNLLAAEHCFEVGTLECFDILLACYWVFELRRKALGRETGGHQAPESTEAKVNEDLNSS